jgi:hypothetical protein
MYTGNLHLVKYLVGRPPTIPVRLHEIFGVTHEGVPTIADGVRPQLELRTPASYTLAFVQNLDQFWDFEYPVGALPACLLAFICILRKCVYVCYCI